MQRRQLIRALPASLIATTAHAAEPAAPSSPVAFAPEQYPTFAAWLDAARTAALHSVAQSGAKNQEQFMQFLALWATAMPNPVEPAWQPIAGANQRLEFASLFKGRPFVVAALKLNPGCVLPVHCHPGGGAVSVCIEGSLVMRHYELVASSAPFTETGATVDVDEVAAASLRVNQFTLFTPTRANLHGFEAGPNGATLVEMTVQWAGTGAFSYFKPHGAAIVSPDGAFRRHRGSWVGMDIGSAYGSA